ncbi:MAG TPA: hypothetical protein VEB21_14950 [Terriglobales bacterium]|nr:hypothetical protein [Terriglobales bacterium]
MRVGTGTVLVSRGVCDGVWVHVGVGVEQRPLSAKHTCPTIGTHGAAQLAPLDEQAGCGHWQQTYGVALGSGVAVRVGVSVRVGVIVGVAEGVGDIAALPAQPPAQVCVELYATDRHPAPFCRQYERQADEPIQSRHTGAGSTSQSWQ